MNGETCRCPCCQQGIEAPHEYHLERRPMASEARCLGCEHITNEAMRCLPCPLQNSTAGVGVVDGETFSPKPPMGRAAP